MNEFITKTLGIKDKNIKFEKTVEEKVVKGWNCLFYFGKLTYTPTRCAMCGYENSNKMIIKNGMKKSKITLNKMNERPSYLILDKQRFYCKHCESYFTAETNLVDAYCNISNNTKLAILNKANEIRSEKSIAQACFVSPSTVSRYIDKTARQLYHTPFQSLPEHIMMDEFKSVKNVAGSMSFIFADAQTHCIVDIVEDRRLSALKTYFSRFPLNERQKVKTITIDMYEPYISLIKTTFPNAKIIIDRFHIVQALNRALNIARVAAMNAIRYTNNPDYNKCKRYWKLVLKPIEYLELFHYKKVKLFKEWKTEKGIVDYILSLDSKLDNTYQYVNKLRLCLKNNDYHTFVQLLSSVNISSLHSRFKPVIRSLRKYSEYIKHTIEYNNLTNGPIEGINNKIKLIKRVSFGYRSYYHLRNRIILCSRLYADYIKKEIKQPNYVVA